MIAQALSLHLARPTEEIRVVHNPENPERPMVEVKTAEEVEKELESRGFAEGEFIDPKEAPVNVAERLGYRCAELRRLLVAQGGFLPQVRPRQDRPGESHARTTRSGTSSEALSRSPWARWAEDASGSRPPGRGSARRRSWCSSARAR